MTPIDTASKPSPVPHDDGPSSHVEPADADPTDQAPVRWSRRRRIITAVLAVLVVAAATGTWYLASRPEPADIQPAVAKDGAYTPGSLPSDTAAAAVRAAVDKVPEVLSYDYRTLDENLSDATAGMTPTFADTFTATFNKVVEPMATKNKAVTKALVRGAGLAKLSDDESTATCVLFVDQLLVTSKGAAKQPHVGKERVTATLKNVDGTWLLDDIDPF